MPQNENQNVSTQHESEEAVQEISGEVLEEITGGMTATRAFRKTFNHIASAAIIVATGDVGAMQDLKAQRSMDALNKRNERSVIINGK